MAGFAARHGQKSFFHVRIHAIEADLLAGKKQYANTALRPLLHLTDESRRGHHRGHACAVVQRTGAFVPRIDVGAQHEIVAGILTARDLANDVRAFRRTDGATAEAQYSRYLAVR